MNGPAKGPGKRAKKKRKGKESKGNRLYRGGTSDERGKGSETELKNSKKPSSHPEVGDPPLFLHRVGEPSRYRMEGVEGN